MSVIKELTSPTEVVDFVQAYLGTSQSAMYFTKFFVTNKTKFLKSSKLQQSRNTTSTVKAVSKQEQDGALRIRNQTDYQEDDNSGFIKSKNTFKSPLSNKAKANNQSPKPKSSDVRFSLKKLNS